MRYRYRYRLSAHSPLAVLTFFSLLASNSPASLVSLCSVFPCPSVPFFFFSFLILSFLARVSRPPFLFPVHSFIHLFYFIIIFSQRPPAKQFLLPSAGSVVEICIVPHVVRVPVIVILVYLINAIVAQP
ncbi:hypothetical protein GGR51DRAFT_191413 [Nemania sp. FL0031]|nr:hypothetical protein GGR51DRAFT_191413 [Nemania sp. FL0031]